MTTPQRTILVVLSFLATTVLFAVAVSGIAPMMHWLDRHPGAVTVLRMSPPLSVLLVVWANRRRRPRHRER